MMSRYHFTSPANNSCRAGKICRKLDNACSDSRGGGSCIGLCVPPVGGPPAKAQSPPWLQNGPNTRPGQAKPNKGIARCPASFACPGNMACVADPHDTLASIRGPSFKCVEGYSQCGGFQNLQCQGGQLCVPDPRVQW